MALRLGADAVAKLMLGTDPVSRLYLGTELVWSASPFGPAQLADNFASYAANERIENKASWTKRYFSSAYAYAVGNGAVESTGIRSRMNCYRYESQLSGLAQWSTVRVVSMGTDTTDGIGVLLRHNASGGLLARFMPTFMEVRSGDTSSTLAGTQLATWTYASLGVTAPVAGNTIGATVTPGSGSTVTVSLWINNTSVATWTGSTSYAGLYAGFASNASAGSLTDWKAGVLA